MVNIKMKSPEVVLQADRCPLVLQQLRPCIAPTSDQTGCLPPPPGGSIGRDPDISWWSTSQRSGSAGSHGQSRSAQITLDPSSFNTSHSPSPHGPWTHHWWLPRSQSLYHNGRMKLWTWLRSAWQERSSGHQTCRWQLVGSLKKQVCTLWSCIHACKPCTHSCIHACW